MIEHENELAEPRRYYQDLVERFEATDEGPAAAASKPTSKLLKVWADGLERQRRFRRSAPQALAHLDEMDLNGDFSTFVDAITVWARDDLTFMRSRIFLKQIYEAADDPEATARVLVEALCLPRDSTEAHRKINNLEAEVRRIRQGRYPEPGRSALLASYFWALQDRTNWPVFWLSARNLIKCLTNENLPTLKPSEPADSYQCYRQVIQEFDDDVEQFERVAVWWDQAKPTSFCSLNAG